MILQFFASAVVIYNCCKLFNFLAAMDTLIAVFFHISATTESLHRTAAPSAGRRQSLGMIAKSPRKKTKRTWKKKMKTRRKMKIRRKWKTRRKVKTRRKWKIKNI